MISSAAERRIARRCATSFSGDSRLVAALALWLAMTSTHASCTAPPVAGLPAASAQWGPQDEEFFAGRLCKQRGTFDLSTINSRSELEVAKSAVHSVLSLTIVRSVGPPFEIQWTRPPPVSVEGWSQLNDVGNAVPHIPGARLIWRRDSASRIYNFRVLDTDRFCVDIEFNLFRPQAPKFVQTHRFERRSGEWLFTGFAQADCTPVAKAPGS